MSTATAPAPSIDDPLPHQVEKHRNQYSLTRALRLASSTRGQKGIGELDGLELEVSQEIARRSGATPEGFFIPLDCPIIRRTESRDLTSSTGSGAVSTRTDRMLLIDVLRSKSVCASLGARTPIAGVGTLRIPRRATSAQVTWVAEGAAPGGQSSQTIDNVTMTPKTANVYTDSSRTMITTQPATPAIIIEDLVGALGAEMDRVGLNGTGADDQPTGIRATAGVPVVAIGTNGGAPTWAKLCEMEATLGLANGDVGRLGWATTPAARSKLRQTEKAAGSGLIWGDDNRMAGMVAVATTGLPANLTKGSGTALSSLILGAWDELIIPIWGAVDVLIDPYKFSGGGVVRITSHLSIDVAVRHAASFVLCNDLVTT